MTSKTPSNEQESTSPQNGTNGSRSFAHLSHVELALQMGVWSIFRSNPTYLVKQAMYDDELGTITPGMIRESCRYLRGFAHEDAIAIAKELERRFAHLLVEVV